MTGAEHRAEAERLTACDDLHDPPTAGNIALAQVHATLALADAQARVADFLDRFGVIAMHTVFAGWTEQQVADAQAWVRALVGLPGGEQQ